MAIFCTISTFSHLYKAFALADSLAKFSGHLKLLLLDGIVQDIELEIPKNITVLTLEEIDSDRTRVVLKKYKGDQRRWALKSVLLLYVLKQNKKVIYVDNDIYFFNDYSFLEEELNENAIILTPHFYPADPKNNQTWLEANFRIGLYNAGFVGVNRHAISALEWWSDCCLYEVKKSYWRGLFDDQKYLDLFPVLFDGVKIIKHRGCNFAGWNSNSNIDLIQIVFIHFNSFTMNKFKNVDSKYHLLFTQYVERLKVFNPAFEENTGSLSLFKLQKGFYFLKWKLARLVSC